MDRIFETETVWRPAREEIAMALYLDHELKTKGLITCPGCKPRAEHRRPEECIMPEKPECTSVDNASALDVMNAVCIVYGVALSDLQGDAQSGQVTAARRHAIWFLEKFNNRSVAEAGDQVGRDERAASKAIKLVEEIRRGQNTRHSAETFTKLDDEIVRLLGGKRG